ncbi:MAG: alpha/beta hydrolase [Novosphingobium sp.]|nr:alpha/beta hydrolase [Novosphingobium sp.]
MKKWLLRIARALTLGLATVGAVVVALWWYYHPAVTRTDGVVYGRRDDRSLTLDVFRPARPNGRGVAFLVSGGWKSKGPGETPTWPLAPLLRRGYTVFAVCHVSQPEATVMEIVDDMHRALRYIRHHAADYGVDPQRLGVSGGSAGGHLSLMLATRGGPGDRDATDPVDRESSAVQAVAIFYPVTDLLDLDGSTEDAGDGGPPKSFVKAFGPDATDRDKWPEIGKSCSPLHWITAELPPTLIYHGDADTLTPLNQSLRFQRRAADYGREVQVVIHPGGGHGWLSMVWDVRRFADWFDRHL